VEVTFPPMTGKQARSNGALFTVPPSPDTPYESRPRRRQPNLGFAAAITGTSWAEPRGPVVRTSQHTDIGVLRTPPTRLPTIPARSAHSNLDELYNRVPILRSTPARAARVALPGRTPQDSRGLDRCKLGRADLVIDGKPRQDK